MLDAVRRIVRVLRVDARDVERRVGVSGAQLFVLQCLAAQGSASMGELAALVATDPSSVSVVVARLAGRGLVARKRADDDARRAVIVLTARGRALVARAPTPVQDRLIAAVGGLSPRARKTLAKGLGEIVARLDADEGAAPMLFEEPVRRR